MPWIKKLLQKNKQWAASVTARAPGFFSRLAPAQSPEYLWVGCSDSRVPEARVAGFQPGEVFVHRNIANQADRGDLNFMSVLEYAVAHLRVRQVVVCGHYGCGGVSAAVSGESLGLIDRWLEGVRHTADVNASELQSLQDEQARMDYLCELNVMAQVSSIAQSDTVLSAWDAGQPLRIDGLIYRMEDGLLKRLGEAVGPAGDPGPPPLV